MALGRKSGHTTSSAPAIHVVAHDRMADRRDMNADLVSPSGMEMGTKKVPRIEPSKAYEVGLGRPTLIDDCHALPVSGIARYRLVDSQLIRGQVTPRHNRVPPRDAPGRQGGAQKAVGAICFGDDQKPGGFLVESMDHPGPIWLISLLGEGPASPNQGVDQSSSPVPRGRVDDHARRLVDHQQGVVLVDDFDRNVLTEDLPLLSARDLHPYDFTADRLVACAFATAINQYVAVSDEGGSLRSR